jgi:thioredoxin-related protein
MLAGFTALFFLRQSPSNSKHDKPLASLQPIKAYQRDEIVIIDKNFITSNYLLLAYMNTDCNHCDYMTEQLCKNTNRFKKCQVVLLAQGSAISLEKFKQKHQLDNFKEILLLHDKDLDIAKNYKINSTPYFLMFNKHGSNILTLEGETRIENLLNPLQ